MLFLYRDGDLEFELSLGVIHQEDNADPFALHYGELNFLDRYTMLKKYIQVLGRLF